MEVRTGKQVWQQTPTEGVIKNLGKKGKGRVGTLPVCTHTSPLTSN